MQLCRMCAISSMLSAHSLLFVNTKYIVAMNINKIVNNGWCSCSYSLTENTFIALGPHTTKHPTAIGSIISGVLQHLGQHSTASTTGKFIYTHEFCLSTSGLKNTPPWTRIFINICEIMWGYTSSISKEVARRSSLMYE